MSSNRAISCHRKNGIVNGISPERYGFTARARLVISMAWPATNAW